MTRTYHERKALRSYNYSLQLKEKLHELKQDIPTKIDELEKEIARIECRYVTLRCRDCHTQYNVPILHFINGSCDIVCESCKKEMIKKMILDYKSIIGSDSVIYDPYHKAIMIEIKDLPWKNKHEDINLEKMIKV